MRRPTIALAALLSVLVALVAAGCGSSSGGGPTYTLSATQKCLKAAGDRAFTVTNQVLAGSQGNLEVQFTYGTEDIYVVFGKNKSEAEATQEKAVTQAALHNHIDRATVLAGVTVDHNVFYYSDYGPLTAIGRQKITACLR